MAQRRRHMPTAIGARKQIFGVSISMLRDFLSANREIIIARTREKVRNRPAPRATPMELENGIPLFLTQLIEMLQTRTPAHERAIGKSATSHGADMLRTGFTVGQVVHDYGGLCQAITEL